MIADLFSSCLKNNYAISKANDRKFCCAVIECDTPEITDIVERNIRTTMHSINHRPVPDVVLRSPRYISIIAYDRPERMDLILNTAIIEPFKDTKPNGEHGKIIVSFAELNGDKTPDEFYERVLRSKIELTY